MPKGKITDKQARFCAEYLVDMNATQAAIRAGYSKTGARFQSSRLLANVGVQNYLQDLRQQQQSRTLITADAVLKELAILGFSKITDVLEMDGDDVVFRGEDDLSDEAQRAIQSITVFKSTQETDRGVNTTSRIQVKMHSKISALKELGNHLGIFQDFNAAISTLKQYGTVEPTEDGHTYRNSQADA